MNLELDTPEFKALAEWLESKEDIYLEEIAKNHNVEPDAFRELVSEVYTRCTHAAVDYHSDKKDELSQGGAAQEHGVELWIYLHFKMKFGVHHSAGGKGLKHAEKLKENELYLDNF